ncbi:BamA/TamA family outer membrane protein [Anaeromyxobacter oryzae]|uniref:Bacterial surface antigen (D15) domain-containing protein n=1 Tax=Anaeromyxobacter oryzae TaxID=2918170 RepID=A0ABN6MS73_9BACT|nr:hypothetical protein [Anaeromyxobacter oryzae]BDG03827.1 hypothetical protein AMOR_28230 [Anaeromyxobacter oryzae]
MNLFSPKSRLRAATAALALAFAGRAAADCPGGLTSELIPLPVYATLPNEGDTWGVLPVVLRVCRDDHRTESIFAPSLTWNSVIRFTGTFRWFHYPREDSALTIMLSASTRTNYNNLLVWQRLPTGAGRSTDEVLVRLQRSIFERFFGIGPDAPASAESSYTSVRLVVKARRGVNVLEHVNAGLTLALEGDGVQSTGVPGLPLSPQVFPDAPGMRGATLASQGLDVRYDDRRGGDYAERGLRFEAGGAVVEGIEGSPTFLRGGVQVRAIWAEAPRLSGAARGYWTGVTSGRAPFYQQSALGGSLLLRGFTEGRFVDRQAWTVELEQRIQVLRTNVFGVITDWRVDPFVAVGQVFGAFRDAGSRPRAAAGAGFRAFVHPNVLGRVDVAYAGEGVKVYVELGYPY